MIFLSTIECFFLSNATFIKNYSINLNIVIYYWTERYEIGVGVMKVQHLENNGKAFNGLH